jgi:hypothetical protein
MLLRTGRDGFGASEQFADWLTGVGVDEPELERRALSPFLLGGEVRLNSEYSREKSMFAICLVVPKAKIGWRV